MDGLIAKHRRFLRLLAGCLVWVACADLSGHPVVGTLAGDVPRPANGKAMMVFVRPTSFFTNMKYEVFDGDDLIAAGQPSGRCHLYEAEPGTHMFSASVVAGLGLGRDGRVDPGELSKRRFALLPADLAEGKFYYVLVRQWNMFDGGFGIEMRPISRRSCRRPRRPPIASDPTACSKRSARGAWVRSGPPSNASRSAVALP